MKVLVACEFSGIVRDAFIATGHDAWSCDLEESERKRNHIKTDVRNILSAGWDLMIAHPPCTYLTVAGNKWYSKEQNLIQKALDFVLLLANAPIEKIAIENPVGRLSTKWKKPTQIIHPWQFGHIENKRTCLWLKNLPQLHPTIIATVRFDFCHREAPGPDRSKNRSRTYTGIAKAMANQWGAV